LKKKQKFELAYGLHAVRHIFQHDISRVLEIWVQEGRNDIKLQTLLHQAQQQKIAIQTVAKKTLDNLTQHGPHQGIVIRHKPFPILNQTDLPNLLSQLTSPPFLLILDEIQDPHNLGACLRTAEAAGVHAVIIPSHRACGLSAVVRKVASGATDTLPLIQVTNLASTLRELQTQGVWIIGADGKSETSLFEVKLTGALAFVLGAEGDGLRRLTRETCDVLIHIPMLGQVESLNVSVATGICLYEALRQRLANY
jgi:23S rRNA (guanosine2251-2'-O)-methyltransferase